MKVEGANAFEKENKFQAPSPGTYENRFGINKNGKYFNSKIASSKCRIFPKEVRRGFDTSSKTPGVGSYKIPSEFVFIIIKIY